MEVEEFVDQVGIVCCVLFQCLYFVMWLVVCGFGGGFVGQVEFDVVQEEQCVVVVQLLVLGVFGDVCLVVFLYYQVEVGMCQIVGGGMLVVVVVIDMEQVGVDFEVV